MKFTRQEEFFFNRVALVLAERPSYSIDEACQAVLDADSRILNTYSRLNDQKQRAMRKWFSDKVYQALQQPSHTTEANHDTDGM